MFFERPSLHLTPNTICKLIPFTLNEAFDSFSLEDNLEVHTITHIQSLCVDELN